MHVYVTGFASVFLRRRLLFMNLLTTLRSRTEMNPQQFMLELTSDPQNVAAVESFVQNIAQRYKLNADVHGNILISLTEAVNNAIIHGNRRDRSKTVCIRLRKQRGKLAIEVSDQGRGFDYRNLPDPTAPENITRVGGRGVFLMRQLADSLRFHNGGRTVEMLFKL